MKIESCAVDDILPYAKNSRTHSDDQVAQIACEKTSRRCFGMEIDPKYCDIVLKRWEDFTGKTAELA